MLTVAIGRSTHARMTQRRKTKRAAPTAKKRSKKTERRRTPNMSELTRMSLEDKPRAMELMLEAMARPATFEEVSDRLGVAKATLAKAIAAVGGEFEDLRAQASYPARRDGMLLMAAVRRLAGAIAADPSAAKAVAKEIADSPEVTQPTKVADESVRPHVDATWPDSFEGWVRWSAEEDVVVFSKENTDYDEASRMFLRWILAQPSTVGGAGGAEANPLRVRPLAVLLGQTPIHEIPPRRARLAVATLEKIFALPDSPKYRFSFEDLRFLQLWALEQKVPGAARAMTVGCHLNPRKEESATLRLDRASMLSTVLADPTSMTDEERRVLLDGQ